MYAHLRRGAVAGGVGGGAYGLYVALVANPLVEYAEELAGGEHAPDAVGEGAMHVISIGSGVVLGVLFGVIVFGAAAYLFEPALPDRGGSYLLGLAGFLTASGVPWIVLPPAAPGVEASVETETGLFLYAGLMAAGAAACLSAGWSAHRVARRGHRPSVAGAAGLAVFGAVVGIAVFLAPAPTYESALPAEFEAAYVGAVVVGQLGLWGVTAATHARLEAPAAVDRPSVSSAPAD